MISNKLPKLSIFSLGRFWILIRLNKTRIFWFIKWNDPDNVKKGLKFLIKKGD